MKQVSIGIYAHEQPEQLQATLDSLRRNTVHPVELVLLPDGPDAAMREALRGLGGMPQLGTASPQGAPACFNRLASNTASDLVVLLESGSQVGPGWLEHLISALEAAPRNGLAGPSTNCAWNEQCVYAGSGGSAEEIARTANAAASRFGGQVRTLEPLYSLADFCYAVRREVIEDIGGADETYGLGPCWEMDYNIRAARAGWHGVWACAAYVHRAPFTARRAREEAARFEFSRRRYQDKFCGGRLRAEKTDYRDHCRGDACPNFAPPPLIEIKRPFRNFATASLLPQAPLVSCIMPTANRRRLIPQAIRCFLLQEYSNLELIIVDDGTEPVADCLPADHRIRYFRLDRKLTVGAKRNFACAEARGDFIAHWDDDDWYAPSRINREVNALLAQSADVCGSSSLYFYAPATEQAWEYRYAAGGPAWVAGTTMLYRKDVWEQCPFPDLQVGEDAHFVCFGRTKKVCDLNAPELFVGMVHSGNTSYKETNSAFWHAQSCSRIQQLLGDTVQSYRALLGQGTLEQWPLISCIMPTYNRRPFLPLALRCFLDQDYPNKELIIIDDGTDPISDIALGVSGVRHVARPARQSIGAKRNLACAEARGAIIAHWDDDDWYAPERLRYQALPIIAGDADITGLENSFVLDSLKAEFWTMKPELHRKAFFGDVHGGTLVYRRDLLTQGLRYPELNLAEDAWLLHQALASGRKLMRLSNSGVFVYVRHRLNAWRELVPGRFLDGSGWERTPPPPTLPADVPRSYRAAAFDCAGSGSLVDWPG
jgi:glycosyltransferase involved in cell wall biosynthesis